MPLLVPALEIWIADPDAWIANRIDAYAAWKHHSKFQPVKAIAWLAGLANNTIVDVDDRLTSALLIDLYPEHIGPDEVLSYLRPPSHRDTISGYSKFWRHALLPQSRPQDFAVLADAWARLRPATSDAEQGYEIRRLRGETLAAALIHAGDAASIERIYNWLGICVDQHGFSTLRDGPRNEVAQWFEARPDRIKAILSFGYQSIQPAEQGHWFFWEAEQRLPGVRMPRDWLSWLLSLAANTQIEELAKYCFEYVACAVVASPVDFDIPDMQDIENWVNTQSGKWPAARQWLLQVWSSNLNDSRGASQRRDRQYKAQQLQAREERKQAHMPFLTALANGTAPVGLLHQLALAYNERFSDVHGDTPLERVQDFLVTDEETARAALAGLERVLTRQDIPSPDDILATAAKGRYHPIRPAALLAAQRLFENAPTAPLGWTDGLTQQLVAFFLTEGIGDMPGWYRCLVFERPTLVAPILIRYATSRLRLKGITAITGLGALALEPDHRELARLVLPDLLDRFPLRASAAGRGELNRSLLAALNILDEVQAARIVSLKLAKPGLDAAQRVCWLVADLPYRADAAERLAAWVGKNERRATTLGVALYEQSSLRRTVHRLSPSAVRRLIEVLAPITPRDPGSRAGWVTVTDHREETVRGLFEALSSNPSKDSSTELRALRESNRLGNWRDVVDYSIGVQRSVAREALFKAPDPEAVALVIANLAPANAADLQALVMQHLSDIEADLRGVDTHLVREFWKIDENPQTPRDENFCRDLVLSKLRERVRHLNVHVSREHSAAGDKRADMAAEIMRSGRRIAVPIEVKKENSDKLWTAWRDQLKLLYTIDPAADGYGLYLVLWFGARPRATPEGAKPRDASHMRELIVERIPEADRHRLAVHVLDLSLSVSV